MPLIIKYLTRIGLLGLAAELSDAVTIAIALVHDSMDGFVPRLANLVEGSCLWLLALVCREVH